MRNYKQVYQEWLQSPYFDEKTKKELRNIGKDEKEIEDRFYQDLSFGTGGLRGVMGAGTNRMNQYTVRKATQGLANYILKNGKEDRGVVIAFDTRKNSNIFAKETANVLLSNGIKVYLWKEPRPTPELSFAIRKLHCIAGVVITASHNPPEYNGYKVYWEEGGQIVPPVDSELIQEVNSISNYSEIQYKEVTESPLLSFLGKQMDEEYKQSIKELMIHPEAIAKQTDNLKVVYTPLHGTGKFLMPDILEELGFKNIFVVSEQMTADGEFSTVEVPNPEKLEAFTLALNLAKKVDADIVIATDPDADRFGVYVKNEHEEYIPFSGNMSGIFLGEYELSQRQKNNTLPEDGIVVKTIVSSPMGKEFAKKYRIRLVEVLTGFKYIAEQIEKSKQARSGEFLFGYEESNGFLLGDKVRDKDGISAIAIMCEAAAYYACLRKNCMGANANYLSRIWIL